MAALQLRETWAAAVNRLVEPGWVRLPEALAPAGIRSIIDAPHPSRHELPEEEGVVRQHARGSYLAMDAGADAIKAFASEVVGGVVGTAEAQGRHRCRCSTK